ncbi:hypothetical protein AAFF_G00307740 [Aldrovandia affinis]|uniref:Uncharacterized protein n=1 Tax=Aldrovandia affinis TaxID=143900 RepID=A0AAD7W0N5_9TELE|nr:hypothetical protein AAFF_G00307740 [Aldrovandia affinis]
MALWRLALVALAILPSCLLPHHSSYLSSVAGVACTVRKGPATGAPRCSPGRRLSRFLSPDVGSTSMLLLSLDEDTLFVGARDAVIALDAGQPGAMETKRKLDWIPSSKDLDDCSMKGKNMERARARTQHRQQREAGRLRMRSSQEDSPFRPRAAVPSR